MPQEPLTSLQGRINLKEVFNQGVFLSCPFSADSRWIGADVSKVNALSAEALTLAEQLPVITCKGGATHEGLELLTAAGLPVPDAIHTCSGREEFVGKISGFHESITVIPNYLPADTLLNKERFNNPVELLNILTNKKYLDILVPQQFLPKRTLLNIHQLREMIGSMQGQAVFKAAVDATSKHCAAVAICSEESDFSKVLPKLEGCQEIIVEEYVDLQRCLTLQLALTSDRALHYLGASENVVDEASGATRGHWLDTNQALPSDAMNIAVTIATRCLEMGYHGFLAIKYGVGNNDELHVLDIDITANSLTCALNFQDSIRQTLGKSTMLLGSWFGPDNYSDLITLARNLVIGKQFIPLWSYDPAADQIDNHPPILGGLLLGTSRGQIKSLCDQLPIKFV